MNLWILLLSFAAGTAAGTAFFSALRWTTRQLPRARRPVLLVVTSLIVRMAVVIGVFLLLSRFGRWEPLVAGLGGFLLIRVLAVRRAHADLRQGTD